MWGERRQRSEVRRGIGPNRSVSILPTTKELTNKSMSNQINDIIIDEILDNELEFESLDEYLQWRGEI